MRKDEYEQSYFTNVFDFFDCFCQQIWVSLCKCKMNVWDKKNLLLSLSFSRSLALCLCLSLTLFLLHYSGYSSSHLDFSTHFMVIALVLFGCNSYFYASFILRSWKKVFGQTHQHTKSSQLVLCVFLFDEHSKIAERILWRVCVNDFEKEKTKLTTFLTFWNAIDGVFSFWVKWLKRNRSIELQPNSTMVVVACTKRISREKKWLRTT